MANPYYIPHENKTLDFLKLGLQLYGMKQHGDLSREKMALTEKENLMRGQEREQADWYANENLLRNRQKINVDEQRVGQMTRANQLKVNEQPHLGNWGTVKATIAKKELEKLGVKKDFYLFQKLEEMAADPNVTNEAAFMTLKAEYPQVRNELRTMIAEDFVNKLEKDQNYIKSPEGMKQSAVLEILDTDETGDKYLSQYFGPTMQSMKRRDAKAYEAENPLSPEQWATREVQQGRMTQERLVGFLQSIKEKQTPGRLTNIPPGGTAIDAQGNPVYTNPNKPGGGQLGYGTVAPGGTTFNKTTGERGFTAPEAAVKPPTASEQRMTAKDVAGAEEKILLYKDNPAVQPQIDLHNQYANKPYAYVWKDKEKKSFLGVTYGEGGEATKIKLPVIKGKQVTAKDVYDTAAKRGMTYEEVLQAIGALK